MHLPQGLVGSSHLCRLLLSTFWVRPIFGAFSVVPTCSFQQLALRSRALLAGGWAGYRREWRYLVAIMLPIGSAGVIVVAEEIWVATFFAPHPGQSDGFGEILAPVFVAVLAGVLAVPTLSALLFGGAGVGRLCRVAHLRQLD